MKDIYKQIWRKMEVHAITKLIFFKSNTGNFKRDCCIRAQGSQKVTSQANKQTQKKWK